MRQYGISCQMSPRTSATRSCPDDPARPNPSCSEAGQAWPGPAYRKKNGPSPCPRTRVILGYLPRFKTLPQNLCFVCSSSSIFNKSGPVCGNERFSGGRFQAGISKPGRRLNRVSSQSRRAALCGGVETKSAQEKPEDGII